MYDFFNTATSGTMGHLRFPQFDLVKRNLNSNLTKIITYYRNFPGQITNQQILVRILESITVGFGTDPRVYRDTVASTAMNTSMSFKLTSSLYKGQVFESGLFLKQNSNEIIIATDTTFDVSDIDNTWRDLQPVRYLHHELTDITMPLLYGKSSRYNGEIRDLDFSVIEINIPMLSLQYQCWRKATVGQRDGEHQSIAQFVKSFPILNAIHSFTDYAIFNRLKAITYDIAIPKSVNTHPFPLLDVSSKLDGVLQNVATQLLSRKLNIKNILQAVPMFSQPSLWETLHIPTTAHTRQIEWALNIARMSAIAWILTLREATHNTGDGAIINYMNYSLRNIKSDNILRNVLDPLDYLTVMNYINDYIKPYIKANI